MFDLGYVWTRLKNPVRLCLVFFFFFFLAHVWGTNLTVTATVHEQFINSSCNVWLFSSFSTHQWVLCIIPVYSFYLFIFFQAAFRWDFSSYSYCSWTVAATFDYSPVNRIHMHYSWLPQTSILSQFFIKNGSYGTIYIFKNYFVSVFSIFSFQF